MADVYLGLGSNLGDKIGYIRQAIAQLAATPQIVLKRLSSFYDTEPVGFVEQDTFVNCVAQIYTTHAPERVLEICQYIERTLKRERTFQWGPRTIDIDILLYDNVSMRTTHLTLPHPRMKERAFVLVPLQELCPEMQIDGEYIHVRLSRISVSGVKKISMKNDCLT